MKITRQRLSEGNITRILQSSMAVLALGLAVVNAHAQTAPSAGGTVHLDMDVPVTNLASPEGQAFLRHIIVDKPFDRPGGPAKTIAEDRAWQNTVMRQMFLAPMLKRYSVKISEQKIGGIVTDVVEPTGGLKPENRNRVLLNVHGGGFTTGSRSASLVESVPIAAEMGIKVISIDYRMGPEFKFPAASQDVEKVYREILKTHDAKQIGLYGCSAGGMLTGQSVAWFLAHQLPVPGAIGIFCASLGPIGGGDMGTIAPALNGMPSHPKTAKAKTDAPPLPQPGYLSDAKRDDPLAFPGTSPELLAKFPPTIFVTGTRAGEMSSTITSNNAFSLAGVETRLHIWDGMIHGFMYNSELPESRAMYKIVARFFDEKLAR